MLVVFYDGWCPVCTAIAERTKKLDTKRNVTFVSFREEIIIEQYRISSELQKRMEERMYAYDGAAWHNGIGAVYMLSKAVPAYRLFSPFVKLSMLIKIGQPLYDFIAKRRTIIPSGHCKDDVCSIPPQKGKR